MHVCAMPSIATFLSPLLENGLSCIHIIIAVHYKHLQVCNMSVLSLYGLQYDTPPKGEAEVKNGHSSYVYIKTMYVQGMQMSDMIRS